MAKFRVDQDEAGNAEVSAPKPQKLKPMEDQDPPKSALKSALKGSPSPTPGKPANAPKSAMKSALKQAPIPEPDEEPAAASPPTRPAPKSALKSSMKKRDPPPEDVEEPQSLTPSRPPGKPKAKSALKKREPAPLPEEEQQKAPEAESSSASSSRKPEAAPKRRSNASRPSAFKMNIDIAELSAWSAHGLCRHYFHMCSQRFQWDHAIQDSTLHHKNHHRKSIADVLSLQTIMALQGVVAPPELEKIEVATHAISPLKELFLAKKPDGAQVRELLKNLPSAERELWVNAPLDATPPAMPAPLFFAVAAVQAELVLVLIEFGVDATAQYPGKSNLKGWLKPNTPLVESVLGRSGRFLGTMLGDKLVSIATMLQNAQKGGETEETEKAPPPPRNRRKSVQMKCMQGVIEHTHDHPSSKYELLADHHDGNPSNIREACHIESGEVFAIKAGSKVDEASASDPEAALWSEIGVIRKLDHPNVVRLHETFENDTHIFMVLEGCLGGELFDRLVSEGNVAEQPALRLAYQMASALRHLHQIQICHRDVQPEAFFLADEGPLLETGVKLIDFTTAKEFNSREKMYSKVSTLHYVAPEIVTSNEATNEGYTEKVDIWSFGVLLFTMISGSPPFQSEDEMSILELVKEGKYEFSPPAIWSNVEGDTKDLINKCLTVDPQQRLDFWTIMEQPAMVQAETHGAAFIASEKLGRAANSGSLDEKRARAASNTVKAGFSLMAEVIRDDEVEKLRAIFSALDHDGTGMVELEDSVKNVALMLKDNPEAADLLKLLNAGGMSGRVNYQMYMATMTDRRRQMRREAARAVFNNFDIDKNGNISLYEIAQALAKHEEIALTKMTSVSTKEVQKIWAEMRSVFDAQQASSDVEMTFDDFFKQLSNENKNIGF